MKILLRWKSAFVASFEHLLHQIENHEAVVAAAIRENREVAASARVRLNRLRRDGERIRTRVDELNQTAATWANRAVQTHPADPAKALECVRRRNLVQSEARHLEAELTAHQEIEQRLQRDLHAIESRIAELGRRRNAYSAREFRARAMGASEACAAGAPAESIEEVFERWETKLACSQPDLTSSLDTLEAEFVAEEERTALAAQLEELLRGQATTAAS